MQTAACARASSGKKSGNAASSAANSAPGQMEVFMPPPRSARKGRAGAQTSEQRENIAAALRRKSGASRTAFGQPVAGGRKKMQDRRGR